MKVIVTGGCGMIGGPLVKYLLDKGDEVAVIDNLSRGRLANLNTHWGAASLHAVVTIGCEHEGAWLEAERLLGGKVDRIYHLAAKIGGVGKMYAEPFGQAINAVTDFCAISHAIKWGAELLYTSTACVYPTHLQTEEHHERRLNESDLLPARPESLYGWGKLYGEEMCRAAFQQHALRVNVVRMFNAVGPEFCAIDERHVIPALIGKLKQGQEILTVWGTGKAERSFLDARDAAVAIKLVADKGPGNGEAFNVGEEVRHTVETIAEKCIDAVRPGTMMRYDTSKPEGIHTRCPNMGKMRNLGFAVRYDINDMIRYVAEGQ